MNVISLTQANFLKILSHAERILQSGGIIATPTDTVYGLIGNAWNEDAIKKMAAMKHRAKEKIFPIFVRDIAMARRCAYISDAKAEFLEKVWPGQVTVAFHHKEKLPRILTGDRDTLALRIPDHALLLVLLKRVDFPLVQTSANMSGMPPAKNAKEIVAYFEKEKIKPELIIDGGDMHGVSSTVIDFSGDEPNVIRLGVRSQEEFDELFTRTLSTA